MLFKEAVSKRIYELCDKYQYTPNRLAEMSSIPPTTLQDLLMEKVANPSSYVIYRISITLKMEVMDFYNTDLFKSSNIDD